VTRLSFQSVETQQDPLPQGPRAWLRPSVSGLGFRALRFVVVSAVVAGITFVCSGLILVNATTVGFAYLLSVLMIATGWGFSEALWASLLSLLCLNFFFLAPKGTFNIAEPENWVALSAFLATSITASRLSARERQRAQEALDRQQEMERLYALSRAILLIDTNSPPAQQIARQIQEIFNVPALALYDRATGEIHRSGLDDITDLENRMRDAKVHKTFLHSTPEVTVLMPIHLSGQLIGSFAIRGAPLSETALQALSNLVAVALEKARGQESANRAEAARQSEEFKSTLLDAIAHEFKTPLTSIKAAATAMLSSPAPGTDEGRELMTIVDEETDRLSRLVSEALQMAHIEAGEFRLNRAPHSVSVLIGGLQEQMKAKTEGREVQVSIARDFPMVEVDGELVVLALRQLLDNAIKYSPPDSPLSIIAERDESFVKISVCDRGAGIPDRERPLIFEKFYRGPTFRQRVPGTGMGLAIALAIARAHGGDITVESGPGGGSRFCLSVHAPAEEMTA